MSGILLAFAGAGTAAVPEIGAAYGGGFFAGQVSTAGTGVADYNLVVGPAASAQTVDLAWKTTNTTTAGTGSVINGSTNSSNMNNASHPSAQFCEAVSAGGFTDWYMPAKNELEVCYYNLKPATTANSTGSGINANAVPARASNYTSGNPARTSVAAFQSGGAEAFDSTRQYWASSEYSAVYAWKQRLGNGQQYYATKVNTYLGGVRAIRKIAV